MEFQSWSSNHTDLETLTTEQLHMDIMQNLHESFEPQIRARSNTWPCPRPDNFVETTEDTGSNKCSNQQLSSYLDEIFDENGGTQQITSPNNVSAQKKNSSRRNAWGNLSYADLITQAISSANDNRLTLSQIYEWMVQNVPYFKDKGDSNSSAGWKNSIRHNLSLHNRFMRVQNEGTGKSSWWMLNPDAKPGKSVRRRAASMETSSSKYEKRRGRAKKRVEALRNAGVTGVAGLNDATPSPSSSVSEGLDMFPDSPLHSGGFQLSPDFRQRASSNASSCGRLSPIPAIGVEPDWSYAGTQQDYTQQNDTTNNNGGAQSAALDQLAGSLADELKLSLQNEYLQGFSNPPTMQNQPPPPPYQPPQPYSIHATVAQSYPIQPNQCPIHRRQQCTCLHNSRETMSPSYPNSEPSPDPMGMYKSTIAGSRLGCLRPPTNNDNNNNNVPSTLMGQFMEALNSQTNLDDLGINLESFQGGLECNVDEVIQQELNIDGLLDINIPISNQNSTGSHTNTPQSNSIGSISLPQTQSTTSHSKVQYPQSSVTSPSWVH